jgi:LysM repeat protein
MIMMSSSNSSYKSIHVMNAIGKKQERLSAIRQIANWMRGHMLKAIVSAILIAVLSTCFLIVVTNALPETIAEPSVNETVIAVGSGDTLWSIANRHSDGTQDIRYVVHMIKERNGLQSSEILPGQRLILPKW